MHLVAILGYCVGGALMGYPGRDSHFAHRFTRLLFRVCAAQEIGTEAVALLTCIVHTEDAKRYRAAVTYWNHQLESILAMSWGRLDRARQKAIHGGWLHYEAGGKGKVGKYWVTIPPEFDEMSDSPFDEDLVSIDKCTSKMKEQAGDNRGTTGGQPGRKRGSFFPNPNPNPNTPCSPPQGDDCLFERFWEEVPNKVGRKAAFRAWRSAMRDVTQLNCTTHEQAAAKLTERMRAFAASPKAQGRFCPSPAKWIREGRYDDDPSTWQACVDENAEATLKRKRDEEYRKRKNRELQDKLAKERADSIRERAQFTLEKANTHDIEKPNT